MMSKFKFALFYFSDKSVKVESTSLNKDQSADQFAQITSRPDLDSDDGWIEINWPTRKEPKKTGDIYQNLVSKKIAFLKGKDIWTTYKRGVMMKKRKTKNAKLTHAATAEVMQNLKTSLRQKKALTSTQDSSDETYIAMFEQKSPDVFENFFAKSMAHMLSQLRERFQKNFLDCSYLLWNPPPEYLLYCRVYFQPLFDDDSEDESLVDIHQPERVTVQIDNEDVITSCGELPEQVKSVKECVEAIRGVSSLQSRTPSSVISLFGASTSSVPDNEIEMHALVPKRSYDVMVPKRAYQRLNRTRMSIFAQELAVLVFTKETLRESTLTGKSSKGAPLKRQLDLKKVHAITDAVMAEFPNALASDVRTAIR